MEIVISSILDIWPMLTIFIVVLVTIRVMSLHIGHEKFVFYKEFINLAFIIYALLIYRLLTKAEINYMIGVNLVPFTEILRYDIGTHEFYRNVIGNIVLFIPFGYFVSMYMKASKISHILIVSIITSSTIEIVQHFIGRSFDIDDILLNVVGSIIGFLLYIGLTAIRKHLPRFFSSDLFNNVICILICLVLGYYIFKFFNINISI